MTYFCVLLYALVLWGTLPQYNVIGRVREKELLKATVDAGILSKLEANGLDLATIEKLLPARMSLTRIVPAAVPSLFHNSEPLIPSSAMK